jgi:hypothetical protein
MPESMQAPPPPARPTYPPPSAFLWFGLLCLLGALVSGVGAVMRADGGQNGSPAWGLTIALCLVVTGAVSLFAQARYSFWRRSAGIVTFQAGERDRMENLSAVERIAQRWDLLVGVNLVVLAAILRIFPLFQSFWFDELWTLDFMRHGPLYALTHQESYNNHLLNSILGSLCLQFYGSISGHGVEAVPPTWVVRFPAFLFGICAPAVLYAAARRHVVRPVALAAAVLLALSPVAIDFSAQARGYAALVFFAIAQAYWLSRALKTSAASAWLGWLACAVLGVLAHLYFIFIIVVDLLFICALAAWTWTSMLDRPRARALVEQGVTLTLAWLPLAFGGYVRVWQPMQETADRFSEAVPMAHVHDILVPLLQAWGGVPQGTLWTVFCIASAALVLLGLRHLARQPSGVALYLGLMLVVPPLLVEIISPHFVYMRFFIFMLPAFLTLVACGIWELAVWTLGPQRERAAYHSLALSLGTAGFFLLTASGVRAMLLLPKQDYAGAVHRLREELDNKRAVASMGLGQEYFRLYEPRILPTKNEAQLRSLVQTKKTLLIVDSGLVGNPSKPPPMLPTLVKQAAGEPKFVFPGRFPNWPYRWLDGDSDVAVYALSANQLRR